MLLACISYCVMLSCCFFMVQIDVDNTDEENYNINPLTWMYYLPSGRACWQWNFAASKSKILQFLTGGAR